MAECTQEEQTRSITVKGEDGTETVSGVREDQGVTKRCYLSWLTNRALVYEPKCGGTGGIAGSQPMSTAVHRSLIKIWRFRSTFNP